MCRYFKYSIMLLLLVSLAGFASPQSADKKLAALLQQYNSYAANFSQVTFGTSNMVINRSSGSFMFQRPGKFRWQTLTPNKQIVIANGDMLWIYDVELAQVTKRKINEHAAFNPAELLTGKLSILKKNFHTKAVNKNGRFIFQLTPKNKQVNFQKVTLEFANKLLVAMQVVNNLGQTSAFTFTKIQLNPKLEQKNFNFKPPKGVDVLQQ